jgi:hypothetical protein
MLMTRTELLEVIYRFYPRGVPVYGPEYDNTATYDNSKERRRLEEASLRGRAEYPTWKAMIRRLGERYGLADESLCLFGSGIYPAYSARIYIPGGTFTFHVSLLGPYYGIHYLGGREEPAAIAREIEATYPGYEPIPPELGNEVVPDVDVLGGSTIYVGCRS